MDILFSFLFSIRWQDIVDITLNSYILFRLYVLFRGTHAFRVITGLALLWVFQRISVFMGLIITSWAIQGIIAVGALIIIIVFRNEIRNVLQAKNLKAILWEFPHKTVLTPVQIIVETVYEMARRRCGALIVFPAKEDIEDFVQGGISWNGLISKEMLQSIFWHDNPVHDGAAIIEGDRIAKVGVILPLSKQSDFPSSYGTRHRAAIGLSEITDALVLVVSEETGKVAVAKDSKVVEIRNEMDLTRKLQDHMGITEKDPRGKLKEKIEIGLAAVLSILFVTGIWFSFTRGMETLVTLEIPIEYMNRDPEMEFFYASANAVNLNLIGSRPLIQSLQPEQIKVRVDLGKAKVGPNTYTIDEKNVTLPPGIFLKKVEPSVVNLTLDVPTEKVLPVQVDWTGKLPDNLILYDMKIVPEKVRVTGVTQILNKISTVYTEKVPVDGLNKTGAITAKLALNPASLQVASGSTDKIQITYFAKERSE